MKKRKKKKLKLEEKSAKRIISIDYQPTYRFEGNEKGFWKDERIGRVLDQGQAEGMKVDGQDLICQRRGFSWGCLGISE